MGPLAGKNGVRYPATETSGPGVHTPRVGPFTLEYVNPDYKVRLDPDVLIAEIRSQAQGRAKKPRAIGRATPATP